MRVTPDIGKRRTDDDASDHRGQHLLQELVLDAAADAVEDLLGHADGQHDHEAEAAADHADHKARAHHPVLVALVLGPIYGQLYVGNKITVENEKHNKLCRQAERTTMPRWVTCSM
jgi:hypothetical protein